MCPPPPAPASSWQPMMEPVEPVDPNELLIDELARVASADPDEGMRVLQCAVQKAIAWMIMSGVEEEVGRMMSGWRG